MSKKDILLDWLASNLQDDVSDEEKQEFREQLDALRASFNDDQIRLLLKFFRSNDFEHAKTHFECGSSFMSALADFIKERPSK